MDLNGENDKIDIKCTGPYVLYMEACCTSMIKNESRGYLQLRVMGRKTPASSFTLNATKEMVCSELQSTVYLKASKMASLYLIVPDHFKVKKLTVALSYLLGGQCDY